MESEDELIMHDAESVEEDFYSGDGADSDDDDAAMDYDFIDNDSEDSDDNPNNQRFESYFTILSEHDIRQRQEESITQIATVLSISRGDASILLRSYNWSVSKVNDEWFADEEKVRRAVGLLEHSVPLPDSDELTCGICFDTYPSNMMSAAACGHPFCVTCWQGYIGTSINDGPGCLTLRCPDPSCKAVVGHDMINSLACKDDKDRYGRYFLRSFIEDNRKTKWCPAPGCDYSVEFIVGSGSYDVTCRCSYSFCWNCTEEAHRPVDCGTVAKWILKNSTESENMNWILANSKPCPKCKRPIEKNQGCMHITCTPPCKYEFCWLCLGAWTEHGERTGGFYACNRYEAAKQEGVYDEAEKRREMAKNSLERYTHYYERWATNQSSRQKAIADLQLMQDVHLERLSDVQCQPESQLKFIIEAWQQIVECRRVLKWTYAYGYYLPEHEHARRQFFEYLQGEAESGLERLHQCAEKELQGYLCVEEGPSKDFNDFRTKLAGLTSVTRNYFENLVRALENGLADVDTRCTSSRAAANLKNSGSGSSSKGRIMSSKNVKPDRVVFNALISACGESGAVDRAFDVLEEMRAETDPIEPDHVTLGALMKACANAGQVDRAREVYKMIDENNMKGTPEVYTIAVNSCSQNGDWEFACKVYNDMTRKGVAPDETFISALIDVAGHADMLDAAFEILKAARAKGIHAGIIAYASLMGACTNAKDWQKALQLYEHIKEINLKPTVSMMNALVTALCDANELQKAIEILFEMKRQGLSANTITYSVLLVASEKNDDLDVGLRLLSQAKKDGVASNPVMRRCLIDMCLRRFQQACALGEPVVSLNSRILQLDNKWTSLALRIYRETIVAGVTPTVEELSLVLGCLKFPLDLSIRNRLIEDLGVSIDSSKHSSLYSLIDGFGEYDPRAFSLLEEAASLGILPTVSLKQIPIVVDLRNLQIFSAEVYLLTVLRGLKHRLAAGARLPNLSILLPLETTQTQTPAGEKTINLAGRVSQAVAAMLRRLGISYIGNESWEKIRINGVVVRMWLQPKLDTPFGGKPTYLSSPKRRLGNNIEYQQRNIRTGHWSLE